MLTKIYSEFISVIEVAIIVKNNLDYCKHIDHNFHFCKSYYSMIVQKKIPKFRFTNYINILFCQKYSDILNNLILIKKIFITCAHLVILIIKLRLSGFSFSILYYWIWDHKVVLLQNSKPLLIILLSSVLISHNMIYIIWARK